MSNRSTSGMPALAVLDVGGTSIKSGIVTTLGDVVVAAARPSLADRPAEQILARLADVCSHLLASGDTEVHGVALAFPGPFDLDAGTALLRGLHKFESIHGVPLRPELRARCEIGDRPIEFARDSEAIGVGEAVFGAGRGAGRVLTVALGTGMAACLTDRGEVVPVVDGIDIERLYETSTPHGRADDAFSARGMADLLGVARDDLDRVGEEHADGLHRFGNRLGEFLRDVVDAIGADHIVVGGGLADSFAVFGPALEAASGRPCRRASEGPAAALVGAARLTFADFFERNT